jgi:hypothetical protein
MSVEIVGLSYDMDLCTLMPNLAMILASSLGFRRSIASGLDGLFAQNFG